ncbi:hypothetical protein L3Q82_015658 [Scortum barcoo]|uniref:Uncharacterized protein n=1 Tax=Scortum barcoo TaxID=214431 RepID=A0ACB8VNE1_9TELE|nr:hypothetical protein L3Q82_015658 [Scortum barcoo]
MDPEKVSASVSAKETAQVMINHVFHIHGIPSDIVSDRGLTNAPAVFQGFITEVLREFLDDFVFVYLDDILIFSPDPPQSHSWVSLSRPTRSRWTLRRPGSQNAKPDVLSRLYEPEPAAKEPEPILPLDHVVGAVSWQIEKDVQQASQDPGLLSSINLMDGLHKLSSSFTMTVRYTGRITADAAPIHLSISRSIFPSLVNKTPRYLNSST